jgi:chemotaxis protein MotB
MARNNKGDENTKPRIAEWMPTWTDMVSLLFCFFVMLYAMSDINEDKFREMIQSFGGRTIMNIGNPEPLVGNPGILDGTPPQVPGSTDSQEDLDDPESLNEDPSNPSTGTTGDMEGFADGVRTYLAASQYADMIEVTFSVDRLGEFINITFADGLLFPSGSAVLNRVAMDVLDFIAEELDKMSWSRIVVVGHTDNVPMRSALFPSNWHLSSARATSVLLYLLDIGIVTPFNISAEGRGEYHPIASNDTAEGRAQNRRVELLIYAPQENILRRAND